MKKNILINCYEYPPAVHGGVGSFTRDLAEGLYNIGWNVTVVGIYSSALMPINSKIDEFIRGVRVIRLPQYNSPFSSLNTIIDRVRLYFFIRQLHKKENFNLIESPESTGWFPFGSPIKPFVVRMHGAQIFFDTELNRPSSRLWHIFEKMTIRRATHLLAVSAYCGNKTLNLIGQENREFTTIYNGIDIEKIDNVRAENSSNEIDNSIVFANSVIPKKGVEELIKAFNLIAHKFPDYRLIIIGKSLGKLTSGKPYLEYLTSLVKSDCQSRVLFTGWLDSHLEVIKYLSRAKICVYPSHMEGQGIAPTEAMALKKPVIFMRNGPGPEVIEDESEGFLVDGKDPISIAVAIERILCDYDRAQIIGENARAKVFKVFDKKKWLNKNIEYYKNIITEID